MSPGHGAGSGAKLIEAESSVAFEAPAKGPNLTLVTDSFLLSRWCLGEAKFAAWALSPPNSLLSSPLGLYR